MFIYSWRLGALQWLSTVRCGVQWALEGRPLTRWRMACRHLLFVKLLMIVSNAVMLPGSELGSLSATGSQGVVEYSTNSSVIVVNAASGVVSLQRSLDYAVSTTAYLNHSLTTADQQSALYNL